MKKTIFGTLIVAAFALLGAFTLAPTAPGGLDIGDVNPSMHIPVKDVSGQEFILRSVNKKNGLLVIFSCNTCPFVIAWEDRYNALYDLCEKNDIGMVLVNSNEAKRQGDDSFKAMQDKAKEEGYKSYYVVDKDHAIADAFGAKTTPHVYLFNEHAALAYKGLIDDSKGKGTVTKRYLEDAINQMVAGNPVNPSETPSLGCSIKRVPQ